MESITFEEFSKLPKKEVNKKSLKPGRNYYIQETRGKYKNVYKGTFSKTDDFGDYNNFENVEFIVNPFRNVGKPFGFNNKSGFKFLEVMEPTSKEKSIKNKTIKELNEFISMKKAEPVSITPEDYPYIGVDYRRTRDRFNTTNNVTKTKRTSSLSSSTARGLKKRKTTKKRRGKKKKSTN
jgi:hypothetical protein